MYICKKCGGEITETEAIKNYYVVEKDGSTGQFIDDFDGIDAVSKYKCTKCGRTAKRTMRALKRIAEWKEE